MSSGSARWRVLPPSMLLTAFALLAITSMTRLSITGDEVTHLPAGYSYLTTGDFRLNPQHPPLIKVLAALPLLALDLEPVDQVLGWKRAKEWMFGRRFLTTNRQPLARIVFWGRLPMVAVGLLLGGGLFVWACRLWGYWPGVFVLLLYTFCPNFLAHTVLVHTDVGVSCFTVLALYALWRYAGTGHLRFAAACGVALGCALLAKYSGLVTAGLVALLFVITVAARRPALSLRPSDIAAAGLVIAAIPLLMIALGFGMPHGIEHYVGGVRMVHADANPHWEAFLWGQYSRAGFWYYYLLAQLWKTPIPTLLCFAAALLLVGRDARTAALDWAFILLPIAAFHAAGMWQRADIGVRHMLPAFPFMMLAGGATARWAAAHGTRVRAVVALGSLWLVVGTVRMWPHFLPYFNELAGGPEGGAFYLDDSNIEWGQAFYAVADYLAAHPGEPTRLLAFRPLAPERFGVHADRMTLRDLAWPEPGITYLAGASYLQRSSLFNDHPGIHPGWLQRYRPLERIGWSIYAFRFSTDPADRARTDVIYVPRERWYADAVAMLQPLVERWPDFDAARQPLAAVYADRAAWHESRGEIDAALRDYFVAGATEPTGKYKTMFRDAAMRLGPHVSVGESSLEAALRAARVTCRAGTDSECLLALLRCVNKDPTHLKACLNLGTVYAKGGYRVLAEREWERCLAVDPSFAAARDNLEQLRSAAARGGGVEQ